MSTPSAGPASTSSRPFDRGLVAVAVIAVALLGSLLWAIDLRSDLTAARSDLDSANSEITMLREQANATAYQLQPTADAPPSANGTAFFALDGTGVIFVANLETLPEGRPYQVWYYPSTDADPLPGATFTVDDTGLGYMLIPADVGLFTQVTVTVEPQAGSAAPTGPVLLTGTTGGARG